MAGQNAAWKNFKKAMTNKRAGKKSSPDAKILEDEAITVQRLSADVSGKAQKYTRIGAREFVPYEYDEVSIPNIRRACLEHFDVGEDMFCDILAREQGPSCFTVKQIPSLNVVHIRFIEEESSSKAGPSNISAVTGFRRPNPARGKKRKVVLLKCSSPAVTSSRPSNPVSKSIPRSMSAVDMLKLRREIKSPLTEILVYRFDFDSLTWSKNPDKVLFELSEEPIGTGGFRQAFKATTKTVGYKDTTWAVKKYLKKTVEDIKALSQTVEQHTRKNVEMHCLARNLAARLAKEVRENVKFKEFGDVFAYNKVYFGKCGEECVTVEEFIPGTFEKHVNNSGDICGDAESDLCKKAEFFVHYSYVRSEKKLMTLDIQGCNYFLCDPEAASEESREDGEFLFCTGNLSAVAIKQFCDVHTCNEYCKLLGLPELS